MNLSCIKSDSPENDLNTVDSTSTSSLSIPISKFEYIIAEPSQLPLKVTFTNNSLYGNSYKWDFGNGDTSTEMTPTYSFKSGGIFQISLKVSNAKGMDSMTKTIYVSPYEVNYTDFNSENLKLYAWNGKHLVILSRNVHLDANSMFAWAITIDSVYVYYKLCTGKDPIIGKSVNGLSTIADVLSTCGAGCGYLGATGIELQNTYFDIMYTGIYNSKEYDQSNFYEFGRNFWFYSAQLAYKENDPITTGYAVLMRFLSLDATGVKGGPFNNTMNYDQFKLAVTNLVDLYEANTSLNWTNTLGAGVGVPGAFGGATDLFASFCMRLMRDYGGQTFIQNLWKNVGTLSSAATTQDAVDNFFLACCMSANKNLTTLFTDTWRWTISTQALTKAKSYQ